MKIGIISDTHGSIVDFKKAMEHLEDADKIIHLGDVLNHGPRNPIPEGYDPAGLAELLAEDDRFVFVKGNCDSEVDEMVTGKEINEREMIIEVDPNVIYISHGHRFSEEEMAKRAKENGANIVLYGHTHKKVLKNIDQVMVVNPGSLSMPKDDCKSFAVFDGDLMKIYELETGRLWTITE